MLHFFTVNQLFIDEQRGGETRTVSYSSLESCFVEHTVRQIEGTELFWNLLLEQVAWTEGLSSGRRGGSKTYSAWRQALPLTLLKNTVNSQLPSAMTCTELSQQVEKLQPGASPQEVARLCLLLSNSLDDLAQLRDQRALRDAWKRMGLKLQVATDQHAAMTEELEALAASDPKTFSQEQIWILIRAIKVQSQVLQMYVGHPLIDV